LAPAHRSYRQTSEILDRWRSATHRGVPDIRSPEIVNPLLSAMGYEPALVETEGLLEQTAAASAPSAGASRPSPRSHAERESRPRTACQHRVSTIRRNASNDG
jgi:hypothetical protein